ncbi:hypothetical protein [Brevundimonas sp.]|uniref:hypothetical protein n=1 Tax=Brevundimonas sp. TaxID=1871086 RepID=UPI0035B44E84
MTSVAFALLAFVIGFQDAAATPPAEGPAPQLTRIVDARAAARCMGGLVGFSNVPVRCTVASDGSMRQCELLTENRSILRYRRRFECMAAATRVYGADGAPAVGAVVRVDLNGASVFHRPRQ